MSYHEITPTYGGTVLSSGPAPTGAESQGGNNVDVTDEGGPPVSNPQYTDQQPLTEGYGPGAAAPAPQEGQVEYGPGYPVAKGRWHRTRSGITAIIIIIILIICAIIGGAVGGTRHHHKNYGNNEVNPTNTYNPYPYGNNNGSISYGGRSSSSSPSSNSNSITSASTNSKSAVSYTGVSASTTPNSSSTPCTQSAP